jgi:predicted phosphodiesterase
MSLQKIALWPDSHLPFEDKQAYALAYKAVKAFKPDILVLLGDYMDCWSVSSHDKNPTRAMFLDDEIEYTKRKLKELKEGLGAERNIYVFGNHEDRVERYLMQKAPELFNTVQLHKLLKLEETGWEHVAYKSDIRIGKLYITHDTGVAGKYAHYRALDDYQGNIIIGHTHRLGYAVVGNAKGNPHIGAMLGWLGDLSKVDYMHRIKAARDWAAGFGLGYMEPNGNVHIVPVPIVAGRCVVEGRLITA